MPELPVMLYRPGTEIVWEGLSLDTLTVATADDYDDAIAAEWVTASTLLQPALAEEPRIRGKLRAVAVDAAAA